MSAEGVVAQYHEKLDKRTGEIYGFSDVNSFYGSLPKKQQILDKTGFLIEVQLIRMWNVLGSIHGFPFPSLNISTYVVLLFHNNNTYMIQVHMYVHNYR